MPVPTDLTTLTDADLLMWWDDATATADALADDEDEDEGPMWTEVARIQAEIDHRPNLEQYHSPSSEKDVDEPWSAPSKP